MDHVRVMLLYLYHNHKKAIRYHRTRRARYVLALVLAYICTNASWKHIYLTSLKPYNINQLTRHRRTQIAWLHEDLLALDISCIPPLCGVPRDNDGGFAIQQRS